MRDEITILDRVADDHPIVSFYMMDPDKQYVLVEERCDNFFNKALNKAEFEDLIRSLQAMCERMVD